MVSTRYSSVKEYLDTLPPAQKKTAAKILKIIATEFPDSVSKIAWNVPQVQINEKYVFGMAAFNNHINLNPWSQTVIAKFVKQLAGYQPAKHTFKVPNDWPVDEKLITDLVKARIKEL